MSILVYTALAPLPHWYLVLLKPPVFKVEPDALLGFGFGCDVGLLGKSAYALGALIRPTANTLAITTIAATVFAGKNRRCIFCLTERYIF